MRKMRLQRARGSTHLRVPGTFPGTTRGTRNSLACKGGCGDDDDDDRGVVFADMQNQQRRNRASGRSNVYGFCAARARVCCCMLLASSFRQSFFFAGRARFGALVYVCEEFSRFFLIFLPHPRLSSQAGNAVYAALLENIIMLDLPGEASSVRVFTNGITALRYSVSLVH